MLQDLCNLDLPFILKFRDAKQGGAHECNDDGSDEREDTFVDVLGRFEGVAADGVEGTDYAGADDQADQYTKGDAHPDLCSRVSAGNCR